jgi:hypothetical protein
LKAPEISVLTLTAKFVSNWQAALGSASEGTAAMIEFRTRMQAIATRHIRPEYARKQRFKRRSYTVVKGNLFRYVPRPFGLERSPASYRLYGRPNAETHIRVLAGDKDA